MGNFITNTLNEDSKTIKNLKENEIKEGIQLIKEWLTHQQPDEQECENYIELLNVIEDIEIKNDFTQDAYEDIRYSLRVFDENVPLKIKRIFNISTMDQYTMFISSRYFDSLDDHINLIMTTRRFKLNMTKFHYNPISLKPLTIKFFPNVETLHLYDENDKYLESEKIKYYCNWNKLGYSDFIDMKKDNSNNQIEFKRIVWTEKETKKEFKKQNQISHWYSVQKFDLIIPERVNELDDNIMKIYNYSLKELSIPSSIKYIPKKCFQKCCTLSKLTIETNSKWFISGNKIFTTEKSFDQLFYLPSSIKIINDKKAEELTTLTIPSTVVSLNEDCFDKCNYLREIIIPSTVTDIPYYTFSDLPILLKLSIPSTFLFNKNTLYFKNKNCIHCILLPNSIQQLEVKEEQITSITIPSDVTKLSDYCFANCDELTEVKGFEHVKEFGIGCFLNCTKLDHEKYPQIEQNKKNYVDHIIHKLLNMNEKKKLEEWTHLKIVDVLFNSDIDDWNHQTSVFNDRIIGKKQLIFLIQDKENNLFGYYLNTQVVEKYNTNMPTDENSFLFSLRSRMRLPEPMKFEIVDPKYGYYLSMNNEERLINLGGGYAIFIYKQHEKEKSGCHQSNACFDYHQQRFALVGYEGMYAFIPRRIVVFQI